MRFTNRTAVAALAAALLGAVPGRPLAADPGLGPLADDPTLVALAVSLACAGAPDASEVPPGATPAPADAGPELELVATVRAKTLRFDEVPKVDVRFTGKSPRRTVWKTERVNLPIHPEKGVVYRDVAVRLTITSTIEELAELLGQAKRVSRGIHLEPDDAPTAAPPAAADAPAATPVTSPVAAPPASPPASPPAPAAAPPATR
jgi:hypothetical protein